ncbi:hypothetical protein RvY_15941 [Ramazzottius varieornatus]|uniref:RRP15-like protein n=1 Tax=Ramazzottius varieornatus TaxID=947166 RepID=A0A1D1W198_RAMVA|nr:hypothetical protein RvY_15941 [Ramazzottius varieornatus]
MEVDHAAETEAAPISGFGDAIQNILKRSGVPQPKKLKREEEAENASVQIKEDPWNALDESVAEGSKKASKSSSSTKSTSTLRTKRKTKKELEPWHVLPAITEREKDRKLAKIATKGVVQLFNAVRAQQNVLEEKLEEAGPSMRKTEQALKTVSKSSFLDLLKNPHGAPGVTVRQDKGNEATQRWQVLEDDYMLKGTQSAETESISHYSQSEEEDAD